MKELSGGQDGNAKCLLRDPKIAKVARYQACGRVERALDHEVVVGVRGQWANSEEDGDVLGAHQKRLQSGQDTRMPGLWKTTEEHLLILEREGGGYARNKATYSPGLDHLTRDALQGKSLEEHIGVDDGSLHDTTIAPLAVRE